jgi:hypothetical protein
MVEDPGIEFSGSPRFDTCKLTLTAAAPDEQSDYRRAVSAQVQELTGGLDGAIRQAFDQSQEAAKLRKLKSVQRGIQAKLDELAELESKSGGDLSAALENGSGSVATITRLTAQQAIRDAERQRLQELLDNKIGPRIIKATRLARSALGTAANQAILGMRLLEQEQQAKRELATVAGPWIAKLQAIAHSEWACSTILRKLESEFLEDNP